MQVKEPFYSPEEYLTLEAAAEFRSEYYNGQIYPMAGASPNHNRIAGNVHSVLNTALPDDHDVFISDMRLWIPRAGLYTYPDVMVVAGALEFAEGRNDTVTNPLLIVEVLSESTKNYDRGEKFEFYRSLSSFQEYLLIDQYKTHVELFSKTTGHQWLLSDFEEMNATIVLSSVSLEISLESIYKKVAF